MSAIFGELMSFDQDNGPEVKLRVYGDELYARYETEDGYTAIYDEDLGLFTYARLDAGRFLSSRIDLSQAPPAGLEKHLEESNDVRMDKAAKRFSRR